MSILDNLNNPLYPNRYERSSGWVRVLPIPGRPLQTSELIEMQAILQDNLKAGMDTLFANGAILKGLRISTLSRTDREVNLSVSSGQIYTEGLVIDVAGASMTVLIEGEFTIGVDLNQQIQTELEDPSLRSPVTGNSVYGEPGAARLLWQPRIVVDNPNAFTIGKIVDGNVIQKETTTISGVEDVLAQYIYEKSGHFCVRGLQVSVTGSTEPTQQTGEYARLQTAESSTREQAQLALQNAVNANNILEGLREELALALRSNPAGSLVIAQLNQSITEAEATSAALSREAVSKQAASTLATTSLRNASTLLAGSVSISVSPGLAYVEGYRVEKTNPTLLRIVKDLPVQDVTSATYVYFGKKAVHERTFTLAPQVDAYLNAKEDLQKVEVSFFNLRNVLGVVVPKITAVFSLGLIAADSLPELLPFIIAELSKSATDAISPGVTFAAFNEEGAAISSYSPTDIRTIVRSNLYLQNAGENKLTFTSVSVESWTNSIQIQVRVLTENNVPSALYLSTTEGAVALSGALVEGTFQLGFRPVAEVNEVVAELEGRPLIVRGNVTSLIDQQSIRLANLPQTLTDVLGDDTVVEILEVYDNSSNRYLPFVNGVGDYELVIGRFLVWRSPNRPVDGTTYYVRFAYSQPLVQGTDYELDKATDSIRFLLTGRKPAIGRRFTVDYKYFLARAGIISINRDGEITYQLGEASNNPQPPTLSQSLLPLASFKLSGLETTIQSFECRALKYSDLYQLAEQVRRNTENFEVLRGELRSYQKAVLSRQGRTVAGFSSEPLINLQRLDISDPEFTGTISLSSQSVTGGYAGKDIPLRYVSGGAVHNSRRGQAFVTLTYTQRTLLSQNRVTKSFVVNSPNPLLRKRAIARAYPSLIFLNENPTLFTPCDYLAAQTSYFTRVSETRPQVIQEVVNRLQSTFISAGDEVSQSILTGIPVAVINQGILSEVSRSTEIANISVLIQVRDLVPGLGGFQVFLNGNVITASPQNGTPIDPTANSLNVFRSKADGSIELSILLPNTLACGSHTIEVIGTTGPSIHSYSKTQINVYNNLLNQIVMGAIKNWALPRNSEKAAFELPVHNTDISDEPSLRIVRDLGSVNALPTVEQRAATTAQRFPVLWSAINQTFRIPSDSFISSIAVRLKSIPLSGDLTLFLKNTVEGVPGKEIYAISRTSVYNPSVSGALDTVFTFERPLLIKANQLYSLSFESSVPGFEIHGAQVGQVDGASSLIGDQLLLQGELFYSADGSSITDLRDQDIAYSLRVPEFSNDTQVIGLGEYNLVDVGYQGISFFCLNTRDLVPEGTSLIYEYSVTGTQPGDAATAFQTFESNQVVCLDDYISSLRIRARLSTTRSQLSPVVLLEGSSVSLFTTTSLFENQSYSLVSRKYEFNPYLRAVVSLDYLQPESTSIRVFYKGGNVTPQGEVWQQDWSEMLSIEDPRVVDSGLGINQRNYLSISSTSHTLFKYKIELSTSSEGKQPLVRNIDCYTYAQP